jgi:hypothetical protein
MTDGFYYDSIQRGYRCAACSELVKTRTDRHAHFCHTTSAPAAPAVPTLPWGYSGIPINPDLIRNRQLEFELVLEGSDSNEQNNDLDSLVWNEETKTYDRVPKKKPNQYRTPCECGIEKIGYSHGHSDWCPRKAIDG